MQTSVKLKTWANIYSYLNLRCCPTLALPDWYPWCCEGGNINTTAQNSSLGSHLDRCSQSWGSHQPPRSHKVMQTASSQLLSVRAMERDMNDVCHRVVVLEENRNYFQISDQKKERGGKRDRVAVIEVERPRGRIQRSWWLRRVESPPKVNSAG